MAAYPQFNIDAKRITVSGISAGAFMAHQLHVAHAELFKGAGLIAGGPFMASGGTLVGAIHHGLLRGAGSSDVSTHWVETLADQKLLAPVKQMRSSRVWLFHGRRDQRVNPQQARILATFYGKYLKPGNLAQVMDVNVGHAWPTAHWGTPADGHRAPYITNVGFDAAGALLAHLDGATLARKGRQRKRGLNEFSQLPFIGANTGSMATTGLMYVPNAATAGEPCGVHVALHGCGQSASQVGLQFAQNTGLNEWAETNRLVVLYPQVRPSDDYTAYNPLGSWDWWGYEDPAFCTRHGRQIQAIVRMVQALRA